MDAQTPQSPPELFHELILPNGFFPNNPRFPLLVYRQTFAIANQSVHAIQKVLQRNHWGQSWVGSIYDYHHYHSTTHEVLVMIEGAGTVQFGGDEGTIYEVSQGDVVIIPAGVAHKSVHLSPGFKCIGAYPGNIDSDMKYGMAEEHPQVDEQIKRVRLPPSDPVFGESGLLFNYWK